MKTKANRVKLEEGSFLVKQFESNQDKQDIQPPSYDRWRFARKVPIMASGVLVCVYMASIFSEFVWVSRSGLVAISAGRIFVTNSPFGVQGPNWVLYSGKLADRIRVTLAAVPDYQNDQGRKFLYLPLGWIILLSLGIAGFVNRRVFYRPRPGQCSRCGYDVRGVTKCPECGTQVADLRNTCQPSKGKLIRKCLVFLIYVVIALILLVSTISVISYYGDNWAAFVGGWTLGVMWPTSSETVWVNEGFWIEPGQATWFGHRFGLSLPKSYVDPRDNMHITQCPIWAIALTAFLIFIIRRKFGKRGDKSKVSPISLRCVK